MRTVILTLVAAFLVLPLTMSRRADAQITTAIIRGRVLAEDGSPMAEVAITLTNLANGNTHDATTSASGEFAFTGLDIPGPYEITAELPGFSKFDNTGILLNAGKTRDVPITMKTEEEIINVVSNAVPRNTSNRTVITAEEISDLPSIDRDPRDLVRLSPEASVEGATKVLMIGGMNNRFNSITVDGIREDDDFGLNASGYPTQQSPISLGVIQEMSIESAPFDVRYAKFMGGNVNIITKTGTNDFHGELFANYSSSALEGDKTGDNAVANANFYQYRYGATLDGPIVKDKLHFIISFEGLDESQPQDYGPLGSTALNITNKVTQADMNQVIKDAQSLYNFNPGTPNANAPQTDYKVFSKVDWQINNQQHFVASFQSESNNTVEANTSSANELILSSDWENQDDALNVVTARLYSDWSSQLSTLAEVDAKFVSNLPQSLDGNNFMEAEVRTTTGGTIILGPNDDNQTNKLFNDVVHGKFEANYLEGAHLVTAGIEYEVLHINNLFVPLTSGLAEYANPGAFEARTPSEGIEYENAVTLNPDDGAAKWDAETLAAYLQDQVRIGDQLTVTGGFRIETDMTGDPITPDPVFFQRYGFSNTASLSGRSILMPRLGASYLVTPDLNVRAGAGLYSGGSPVVWQSNNYSNNGVTLDEVFSENASIIDGFDGRNIPQGLTSMIKAGNGNVDALDPNFKLPSQWKTGIGFDYQFHGVTIKGNYTYSKVREGITWEDLRRCTDDAENETGCNIGIANNAPIGYTIDGRAEYGPNFDIHRGFDLLMTNTNQGYGHVASFSVEKTFPFGLYLGGTAAYQHVLEINPANSSQAQSNFDNLAFTDPNHPTLAQSNYERPFRLTGVIRYSRPLVAELTGADGAWRNMKTTFGLFAEARSGQPYSWTFGDATFGDTLSRIFGEDATIASHDNELFYVPKVNDPNVILNGITQAQLTSFLNATGLSKYRGEIAPRNAFQSPWFNHFDLRFAQGIPNPFGGHNAQLTLDIQNFGNLLDSHWGRSEAAPFPYANPAVDVSIDPATNKYVYSNLSSPNTYVVDLLSSVWRIAIGARYDF